MARQPAPRSLLLIAVGAILLSAPGRAQDAPPAEPQPAAPAPTEPSAEPEDQDDEDAPPSSEEAPEALPGLEQPAPDAAPPVDAPDAPPTAAPEETAAPPIDRPELAPAPAEPEGAAPPPPMAAPAAAEPAPTAERKDNDLVAPVDGRQLTEGETKVEQDQTNLPQRQQGPAGWLESFLGSGEHPKFTVGLAGGYTLRMHDDDRTHGGGLTGFVDVPLAYGFGAQISAYGNGWIPSEKAPDPLGLIGAAGSLIYAFDDTDAVAWVGVGPTAALGIVSDSGSTEFIPHAGVLLSFGVRFPLGDATRAEVAVRAPIYVWDPTNGLNLNLPIGTAQATNPSPGLFPTQVMMTAGLNFEPFSFMDGMADHGNIAKLFLPSWLLFGKQGDDKPAAPGPSPQPKQAPADQQPAQQ